VTTFRIDPHRSKVWIEARSSMHPIHGVADGLEGSIERSYIYSGTANGRLDQWPDAGSFDGDAAIATATVLVEAAADAVVGAAMRGLAV